jgi:hypothetical protein
MCGDRHKENNSSSDIGISGIENLEMSQLPSEIERLVYYKEYLISMKSEEASLKENNIYKIVPRPESKRVLRSRWVLCKKINNETGAMKHKARLTALGCQQVYGVD